MSIFIDVRSTEELLTMWGRWAKSGGNRSRPTSLGIKPCWDIWTKGQERGYGGGVTVDMDTDMMRVDYAMAKLSTTKPKAYKILRLRFLANYSYVQLAERLTRDTPIYRIKKQRMCDKTAKKMVEEALMEIEEFLK